MCQYMHAMNRRQTGLELKACNYSYLARYIGKIDVMILYINIFYVKFTNA